ncbi:unnamed protein product [Orchesella dallaii]|uniref:Uncharacterized protein n=1 Tax=Orchesella dallaii TaxID=48710 RepID=A0ABP1S6Z3_9HEXA
MQSYLPMGKFEKRKILFFNICAFIGTPFLVTIYTTALDGPLHTHNICISGAKGMPGNSKRRKHSMEHWVDSGIASHHNSRLLAMWPTLTISHAPSSFFTRLLKYRELQILVRIYNGIQQDIVVVAVLHLVMVGFTVSNFALFRIGFGMRLPFLLMNAMTSFDTFIIIYFYYGCYGRVCQDSFNILSGLMRKPPPGPKGKLDRKLLKHYVVSFSPLKIFLGAVNFLEKLSPIVILDFCLKQVVNLLLLD